MHAGRQASRKAGTQAGMQAGRLAGTQAGRQVVKQAGRSARVLGWSKDSVGRAGLVEGGLACSDSGESGDEGESGDDGDEPAGGGWRA